MTKEGKNESITISKVAIWQIVTAIFAILFVASLFTGGFGVDGGLGTSGTANGGVAPVQPSGGGGGAPAAPVQVNLEGAHTLGDEDAPVTLVEWSDFQCPFCGRFFTQTKGLIEENYIDTGKVKLVYKHFPLDSIHPLATPAALASECAAEQDKFWEYHDKIFENQASLSAANLKVWAGDLGLDQDQFDGCLDSRKYIDRVTADLREGSAAGVRGTPGFILNGQLISGAQPYSVFQAAFDAALS